MLQGIHKRLLPPQLRRDQEHGLAVVAHLPWWLWPRPYHGTRRWDTRTTMNESGRISRQSFSLGEVVSGYCWTAKLDSLGYRRVLWSEHNDSRLNVLDPAAWAQTGFLQLPSEICSDTEAHVHEQSMS